MNIYVGNLGFQATDDGLRSLFGEFGEVASARVIRDRFSNEPRGFGFVEMNAQSDAMNAIEGLNGREYLGRELTVNEARPKSDSRDGDRRGGNRNGGQRRSNW